MVGARLIASTSQRQLHREEVNCESQSEVIVVGTPNRAIQFEKRALTQSAAVEVFESGTASGRRVVPSTVVKI